MRNFADGGTVTFDRDHPRVQEILREKVVLSTRAALVCAPIALGIAFVLLGWVTSPRNAGIWCGLAAVGASVQWFTMVRSSQAEGYRRRVILGQSFGGLVWGVFPITGMGQSPVVQVLLGAALLSMLASTAPFCAPMRAAYFAFILPTATVGAASFLLFADGDARWVAPLIIVATAFYVYMCEVAHENILETVLLSLQLEHQANTDPLTGLANRNAFANRVQHVVDEADALDERVGLAYLDLDKFKEINDVFGHAAGDYALVAVASRIRAALTDQDFAARIGGDEFAVVQAASSPERLAALHHTLTSVFESAIVFETQVFELSCSVGVSLVEPGASISDAMREADSAQYAAKARLGARIVEAVPEQA